MKKMKNDKFQKLINDTLEAKQLYFLLLENVEEEYEKRFGYNPSEVDDDCFIDTFHLKQGNSITVKRMTEEAKNRKLRR